MNSTNYSFRNIQRPDSRMHKQQEKKGMPSLNEVKIYESKLDGNKFRIVMYQRDDCYGVLVQQASGAICAPNFAMGDGSMLRSMQGNELDIIDWVDLPEANRRYRRLLLSEGADASAPKVPHLRLVGAE